MIEYENNQSIDRELGWDEEVAQTEFNFILLPEGDYDFMIIDITRGRHGGSAKLPPCNKATLHVSISNDQGDVTIQHNLFLHTKTQGFLFDFFSAIGQVGADGKLKMNWNKVAGSTGRCRVFVDKYTDNNGRTFESNKIKYFIDPKKQHGKTAVTADPFSQKRPPQQQAQQQIVPPAMPFGAGSDVPF